MSSKQKWSDSPYWNIVLLALAWALTLTTSTLLTTVGPLSAGDLGASDSLSAFTVGVFLIGAAVSSVPSGWLFRNYGRYWGFTVGCFFQFLGSCLGTISIYTNNLGILYLGCFSIGLAQGLGQFYRFSAVEVTPAELKSRAVTYVLSGGIIAAFLGPTTASYSVSVIGNDYMGSYMVVAVFAILNQVVISFVHFPKPLSHYILKNTTSTGSDTPLQLPIAAGGDEEEEDNTTHTPLHNNSDDNINNNNSNNNSNKSNMQVSASDSIQSITSMSNNNNTNTNTTNTIPPNPLSPANHPLPSPTNPSNPSTNPILSHPPVRSAYLIIQQPLFLLSCTIATLAHTIMVMVMSTVSLEMQNTGYSLSATALVMELHFFAMFSPGFVTGKLIEYYGTFLVALMGGCIYVTSSVILALDTQFWNFTLGMILLGIAWNFAFSAGTVMLTTCYEPMEATEVQAINDFVLFSIAGAGSLLSGVIFAEYGWLVEIYVASVLVSLLYRVFIWVVLIVFNRVFSSVFLLYRCYCICYYLVVL